MMLKMGTKMRKLIVEGGANGDCVMYQSMTAKTIRPRSALPVSLFDLVQLLASLLSGGPNNKLDLPTEAMPSVARAKMPCNDRMAMTMAGFIFWGFQPWGSGKTGCKKSREGVVM